MDPTEKFLKCRLLAATAEAVVDEYLLVNRVVLAAVHVGTIVSRGKGHSRHPRERDDSSDQAGDRHLSKLVAPPILPSEQIGEPECRQHQPRFEHLRLEGDPHPDPGVHEIPLSARHEGHRDGISRQHEKEGHGGVGNVAPVEPDGCGARRQDERSDKGRRRAPEPVHRTVEEEDAQDTLDHLGQDNRPGVVAEDPHGECLDPERTGELVQGDRPRWIKRAEGEVVPVGGHTPDGRCIEGLESNLADPPGVRETGQTRYQE